MRVNNTLHTKDNKVNFLDWMNMNMIIDITFLVFAGASIWKFRQLQNKIKKTEERLLMTIKNPQAAKRLLKEQK